MPQLSQGRETHGLGLGLVKWSWRLTLDLGFVGPDDGTGCNAVGQGPKFGAMDCTVAGEVENEKQIIGK